MENQDKEKIEEMVKKNKKKKTIIIILSILIVLVLICSLVLVLKNKKDKEKIKDDVYNEEKLNETYSKIGSFIVAAL